LLALGHQSVSAQSLLDPTAANLIQNGDFLNGTTSGYYGSGYLKPSFWNTSWNPDRPSGSFIMTFERYNIARPIPLSSPNGGNFWWTGGSANISQSFSTSIGSSYNLSFYLTGLNDNGAAGETYASIDGGRILNLNNQTPSTWSLQSISFTASQSLTTLSLGLDYSTAPGAAGITGISVIAVPEPSAFSLLAVGLGALAMMRRRRL
jgi:hypothetical protein